MSNVLCITTFFKYINPFSELITETTTCMESVQQHIGWIMWPWYQNNKKYGYTSNFVLWICSRLRCIPVFVSQKIERNSRVVCTAFAYTFVLLTCHLCHVAETKKACKSLWCKQFATCTELNSIELCVLQLVGCDCIRITLNLHCVKCPRTLFLCCLSVLSLVVIVF